MNPGARSETKRPTPSPSSTRVLILGLDGATFAVLSPLMEQGLMPHLEALRARGFQSPLQSTDPPVTAPAWTSVATGKRPDTHGLFDWSVPVPGRYRRTMVTSLCREDLAFWEILAHRGVPAGTVNLPLTYPPSQEASFCISGLLTPPNARRFTHPASLKRVLKRMGYRIDLQRHEFFGRDLEPLVADLVHLAQARGRAIRYCLERFPWKAAIAVFAGPDRLQHAFWQHLDFTRKMSTETQTAASYFQALDEQLGAIVKQVGPDTHIYVVSDHGFGTHNKTFYINNWLQERGYLVVRDEKMRHTRRLVQGALRQVELKLQRISGTLRSMGGALEVLGRASSLLEQADLALGERLSPDSPVVDWDNTRAFAPTPHGVQINLEGREPRGKVTPADYDLLRTEIARELAKVVDPRTGSPLHAEVLPREARYTGPRADLAPDLIYSFANGDTTWRIGDMTNLRFGRRIGHSCVATDTAWETGTHRHEGVLIAAGPDIRQGTRSTGHTLWDLAPTLLYHLDQAIPTDLDGRVMQDLIRPEVLEQRAIRMDDRPARRSGDTSPRQHARGQEDPESVAEQLRALGYLS